MGCVFDALWNHGFFGKIIAPYMFFKMKKIIKQANYAIYVTNSFLQERYPSKCKSISASNVNIQTGDEKIVAKRLSKIDSFSKNKEIKLMTSAAVDVAYKGQEYVIKSIRILKNKGINVKYYLAGGGKSDRLSKIAERYDVVSNVVFLGELNTEKINEYLDDIDIYIQPSLQEGLPRSVIEAMNRACPVIGAKTAGIPELIGADFLVKRRSYLDIANKIEKYCSLDNEIKKEISKTNFSKAMEFDKDRLEKVRNEYFKYVKSSVKRGD